MTAVRGSNRRDARGMPRRSQPVVHRFPDLAPPDGRVTRSGVAGYQQKHALAGVDRALEAPVDRPPCLIQVQAVEVENPVRLDGPGSEPPVPAGIERIGRAGSFRDRLRGPSGDLPRPFASSALRRRRAGWLVDGISGERADRRRDARPKFLLVRAERAHGPPCPSGSGRALVLWPTSHPRYGGHLRRRPRTYRPGWHP